MQTISILEIAKRTLNLEAQAVLELSAGLDDSFEKTTALLQKMKGKKGVSDSIEKLVFNFSEVFVCKDYGTIRLHMCSYVHNMPTNHRTKQKNGMAEPNHPEL